MNRTPPTSIDGQRDATAGQSLRSIEMDELVTMSFKELGDLYGAGTVPATIAALDGQPRGRLLAARGLDRGPMARPLQRWVGSDSFVWAGKTFASIDAVRGAGINRVRVPTSGERAMFPFDTRIESSALDGQPCIALDYDRPDNPAMVRRIRDELREVSAGLFMGPAMLRLRDRRPWVFLYFTCDALGA